jgi:hypothetical protein
MHPPSPFRIANYAVSASTNPSCLRGTLNTIKPNMQRLQTRRVYWNVVNKCGLPLHNVSASTNPSYVRAAHQIPSNQTCMFTYIIILRSGISFIKRCINWLHRDTLPVRASRSDMNMTRPPTKLMTSYNLPLHSLQQLQQSLS